MKSYLKIFLIAIGFTISFFLLVTCLKSDIPFFSKAAEIIGITPKNILENGNFANDLNGWQYHGNVFICETNGTRKACIEGKYKGHARIWHEVNVISGQTYRLSFLLTGPDEGSFAIYRDKVTKKDKYFLCKGKNNNKQYTFTINPISTGQNEICLSTDKDGTYYFSNVKINKNGNNILKDIYITISLLIIVYLIRYSFIFLILLFLLATVPVMQFTKDIKSVAENRALAKYKPLFKEGKNININYGFDFNNWINDHFWLRKHLISLNTDVKFLLDQRHENKFVFQSNDGWLFRKSYYKDKNYIATCSKIKDNIDSLTKYYFDKGIKIYFAILPEKECQYSENHYLRKYDKEIIPEYLSLICTNNFIYLKESIEKFKVDGYTHFKEDHHWTQLGAFGGYLGIMNLITNDFNVSVLDKDDFIIKDFYGVYDNQSRVRPFQNKKKKGSTYSYLNLNDKSYKYVNKYLIFIPKVMPKQTKTGDNYAIYSGGKNQYKIIVMGDSNIGYILPFITSSFSNSLFLASAGRSKQPDNWHIKSYDNIILDFNPQIIIVLIRAFNSPKWLELN